jgi:hypothetical protein
VDRQADRHVLPWFLPVSAAICINLTGGALGCAFCILGGQSTTPPTALSNFCDAARTALHCIEPTVMLDDKR